MRLQCTQRELFGYGGTGRLRRWFGAIDHVQEEEEEGRCGGGLRKKQIRVCARLFY